MMQPASRILANFTSPEAPIGKEDLVLAAWRKAVGKKIAVNARASRLVREKLIVEVADAVWQRNLFTLSRFILRNLETEIGGGVVTDLEFRVVPPRREPERARTSTPLFDKGAVDEADGIADPVLRRIYRAARKKETA